MARSSGRGLLAALLLAASVWPAAAVELCEGCWELGGRGLAAIPIFDGSFETAPGIGAWAAFRFRPFWSVGFALDRHPTAVESGPDETLTFFSVYLEYTFRAAREQRTRLFSFVSIGYSYDQIAASSTEVQTPSGPATATTRAASDGGMTTALGGGTVTSLGKRLFLRCEGRWVSWSAFGGGQDAFVAAVGMHYRMGR